MTQTYDNASWQAYNRSKALSRARGQARDARILVERAEKENSPDIDAMRGLLIKIEAAAARIPALWERISAIANGRDPGLIEDAGGISIVHNHGPNPELVKAISAAYAEDPIDRTVGWLFEQLRQLAAGPGVKLEPYPGRLRDLDDTSPGLE
jgi:hypothetical protein